MSKEFGYKILKTTRVMRKVYILNGQPSYSPIMMYKSLNSLSPDYMMDLFNKVSESNSRNLRYNENDLLMIPFTKTRYYDRSFAIQSAKQWNSLPIDIRDTYHHWIVSNIMLKCISRQTQTM